MEEYTRKVTLVFRRSEILDDVNGFAHLEADVMPEGAEHSKHQTFDITQDGNRELCSRIILHVLAHCREILYPFTKNVVDGNTVEYDALNEPSVYLIHMLVPDNFSKTTSEKLEQCIHMLIVYRILAEWLGITNPAAAQKYEIKAKEEEEEIESAKASRTSRTRRKISPFFA